MNLSETNDIIKNYNSLVNSANKNIKGRKGMFISANPVTLHIENVLRSNKDNVQNIYNKYGVTMKADGEKGVFFLLIMMVLFIFWILISMCMIWD